MNLPLIKKYNKNKNEMECPDCKPGDVWCDGTMELELPTGFGFAPGDTKFSVGTMKYKGFYGECMECGKRVFNWTSRRAGKRYPKSINDKLKRSK